MSDIQLRTKPGEVVAELGGGASPLVRPNFDVRACQDAAGNPTVDGVMNFEEPLPIDSETLDGVFSRYVIEHLSWRKVPFFLAEVYRVLKPGGKVVFITANTLAQIDWLLKHPQGWDGKGFFESASCVLFGDQDYPENAHKNFMSPDVAKKLFTDVGFEMMSVDPYGERDTDLVIQARKLPVQQERFPRGTFGTDAENREAVRKAILTSGAVTSGAILSGQIQLGVNRPVSPQVAAAVAHEERRLVDAKTTEERAGLFDKHYFNGGGKVGGYAREGYWDYPVHEVTVRHVLARKPESVLELGCARGYVLKRLQDRGIQVCGLEISKHCHMTRVCDPVKLHDLCQDPWPLYAGLNPDQPKLDLCFSVATLEHVPEDYLPRVIEEMARTCKRGLHGVDFGQKDDGFDKTHCTLKPREWWADMFNRHAPGWPVEIIDKELLERSPDVAFGDNAGFAASLEREVYQGDGKVKLNVGCFTTMFHYGWTNIDALDVNAFAQHYRYVFRQLDVRNGLPYPTAGVDLIYTSHFLEHLTYAEGVKFLRECRRVLKPGGAVRVIVPDAELLTAAYAKSLPMWDLGDISGYTLAEYGEINDGVANTPTSAGKLWALLHEGHSAAYDRKTLGFALNSAGFLDSPTSFRCHGDFGGRSHPALRQILHETLDMMVCLSCFVDAVPLVG